MNEVAKIIHQQIKSYAPHALFAWGAARKGHMIYMSDGFKFKTSGMVRWKGWVYVKYDEALDLYDIDFFRIRGTEIKYDKRVQGVYFDQMVEIIDRQVR